MAKKRIYNKTNIGDIVNGFLVLDAFIKNNVRWYKLKCLECDEVVESRSGSFRKHKACSCGGRAKTAHKIIDMKGQKFGRLTVLEHIGFNNNQALWRCKCECGNEVNVIRGNLRNGQVLSCGCLKKELDKGIADRVHSQIRQKYLINDTYISSLTRVVGNNNELGVKGVTRFKNKFQARITFRKVMYYLGVFNTLQEATVAREIAEDILYKPFLEKHVNNKNVDVIEEIVPEELRAMVRSQMKRNLEL